MIQLNRKQQLLHSMLLATELCQSSTFDLVEMLKASKYNKRNVKVQLAKLSDQYKLLAKYQILLTGDTIGALAEVADKADDLLREQLSGLKSTLFLSLQSRGVKDPSIFTELLFVTVISNIAMAYVEAFRELVRKEGEKKLEPVSGFYYVGKVKESCERLIHLIGGELQQSSIDLTNVGEVQECINGLIDTLKSGKFLTEVLN